MMSDRRLDLAEALLAKAKSSPFDGERESFAAGAYSQLAAYLGSGSVSAEEVRPAPTATAWPIAELVGIGESSVVEDLDDGDPGEDLGDDASGDSGSSEAPIVIDLAAAERAYRGGRSAARPGALIDLTI